MSDSDDEPSYSDDEQSYSDDEPSYSDDEPSYSDDEPIVLRQDDSGENPAQATLYTDRNIELTVINKTKAPLEESKLKVMLELMGAGLEDGRLGVDLVTILDVSGSMGKGDKLAKMKMAMQFVIEQLSHIDRLSVVTFSDHSVTRCPLRHMTEESQKEIEKLVNPLKAKGNTNIAAGLKKGLKVLKDRTLSSGRVTGIMLMSDGKQNKGGDAAQVQVGKVPVYTFGFGSDHEPRVLKAISDKSVGGTFSDVQNTDILSIAFSQCLAGLLTVVVQDLKLTVTEVESTIENVLAGSYPQSRDDSAGSVTVWFGDLYEKELRKVMVDLLLPAVESDSQQDPRVLEITYTYSTDVGLFDAPPVFVEVTRTGTAVEQEREEDQVVMNEEIRHQTARAIKEARVLADHKKLGDAKVKLVDAQNMLEDVAADDDEPNPLIEMLKSELQHLLDLMTTQAIYKKQGRPFALSSETSHDRQRFATRGDVEQLRLFATPQMNECLQLHLRMM